MNNSRPLVSAIKSHDGRVMLDSFQCGPLHMNVTLTLPVKQARDLAARILAVAEEIERAQAEQAAFDAKFREALAADEVTG